MNMYSILLLLISLLSSSSSRIQPHVPFIPRVAYVVHQERIIEAQPVRPTHHALSTTVLTDTEALIIYHVVDRLCPDNSAVGSPTVSITPPRYEFGCAVAAGHSISGTIEQYSDQQAARTAFHAARGDQPLEIFHEYSAYSRQIPGTPPFTEQQHSFQADRWVISATAIDDTPLGSGPPSEAIYQGAARYCLFPEQRCAIYFAFIQHTSS